MIVIVMCVSTSARTQERQQAYSEHRYWFDRAFENGHAFSSSVGARNYQLEAAMNGSSAGGSPSPCVGFRSSSTGSRGRCAHQQWSPCQCLRGRGEPYRSTSNLRSLSPRRTTSHQRWRLPVPMVIAVTGYLLSIGLTPAVAEATGVAGPHSPHWLLASFANPV